MRQTDKVGIRYDGSMTHYLASLIEKREFTDAIKCYEVHRGELEAAPGANVGNSLNLIATAYCALGDQANALRMARRAQHFATAGGDSPVMAEIFMTLGRIQTETGDLKQAEKSFRDAESIFRRSDMLDDQSRALNLLAGLFFRQNEFAGALSILMDAIEIVRKGSDQKKLAFMMGNLGRIYTFTGSFVEARKHLQVNVEMSAELGDSLETVRAWLSLGYLSLLGGEFEAAENELANAKPLIDQLGCQREEVIYLTYLGELLYRSGRIAQAHKTLDQALFKANEIDPDSTLAARVTRHLAQLAVMQGNPQIARRLAARAMVVMEKAGNQVEIGALWKVRAMIAAECGKVDEGRKLFVKALDLIGESNVRPEKALALIEAGRSEVFSPRQRLTYLFRAEEFYSRRQLGKMLTEVQESISSVQYTRSASTPPSVETNTGTCENGLRSDTDYVTACPQIIQFKKQLPAIARANLPLLLTGETGVGKDHLAKYFQSVARPDGPFVAINCASLPETLLESELFGYKRGAFTGADRDKTGLFVAASGGILFLDEVGDMPLSLQSKLLGVLENRKVVPLGSTEEISFDVKLVAATNRDLEQMVEAGEFRRDLYYRLSGIVFHIPPLRERKEDIGLLLKLFMSKLGLAQTSERLAPELVHRFVAYDWPGNSRELLNKVRRLEVMTELIAEGDLVELSRTIFDGEPEPISQSLAERVEDFERKLLVEAMVAAHGNKSEAARMLGIHEATVRTKLKRYGISLQGVSLN